MDKEFIRNILEDTLSFWPELNTLEKDQLVERSSHLKYKKSSLVHGGKSICTGLLIMLKGQLRGFILSEEGKDLTINKLMKNDICILSGSCIVDNIKKDFYLEAVENSELINVDVSYIKQLVEKYPAVKIFSLEILSNRYQKTIGVMENVIFLSLEERLIRKLIEESSLQKSLDLKLTHDSISKDIGSSREVVSRSLNDLKDKGLIDLSRSRVTILDFGKLRELVRVWVWRNNTSHTCMIS